MRISGFDRGLVLMAAAVAVGATYFAVTADRFFGSSFGPSSDAIGVIVNSKNDSRYRTQDSIDWHQSKVSQKVSDGDAVFAGDNSYVAVRLTRGGSVGIDSNSMVIFRAVGKDRLADLQNGNFRLVASGKLNLAIGGKVVAVDGQNADLQVVVVNGDAPQFKLISGSATLSAQDGSMQTLSESRFTALDIPGASAKPTAQAAALEPSRLSDGVLRLHDAYSEVSGRIVPKNPPQDLVPEQISTPSLRMSQVQLEPRDDSTIAAMALSANASNPLGFIVELSPDPEFRPGKTEISFTKSAQVQREFRSAGRTYIRARTVESDQKLSDWSTTETVTIERPAPPPIPAPAGRIGRKKRRIPPVVARAESAPLPTPPPPPHREPDVPSSRAFSSTSPESKPSSPNPNANINTSAVAAESMNQILGHPYRYSSNIWIGGGANYMTLHEDDLAKSINVNYASAKLGSYHVEAQVRLSDKLRLIGVFLNAPGEALSSDRIEVRDSRYNWSLYSGEAMYTPEKMRFHLFNREVRGGLRAGFQHHFLPSVSRVSVNEVQMDSKAVSMASVGLQGDLLLRPSTNMELFLRYQYPLSSAGTIRPGGPMFDGSVGIMTMLSPSWAVGGLWFGQLQNYAVVGETSSTNMQVFFSTLEARLGYILP